MNPQDLGKLWALPIQHKATLGRASEAIIERVYRLWLRSGDFAVDCGANVGRHLFPLAEAVGDTGRVDGFEPIPELGDRLRAEIAQRKLEGRVSVKSLAVSDYTGVSEFHHNLAIPAMSGLKVRAGLPGDSQERVFEVNVDTLDNLVGAGSPRFVKIDVEGAEFMVFRGAERVMSAPRPLFAFEDGRGGSAALNNYTMSEFYAFFEQRQYLVLDMFGFQVTNAMRVYGGPWNFYAVPLEKHEEAREAIVYGSLYELWNLMPE